MEVLELTRAGSLKAVEDLPFLSEKLGILGCECLERVSNLNQVKELRLSGCPGLMCVEGLGGLQQLWLGEDMETPIWMPELQQQSHQLDCEDLDVYTWVYYVPNYVASKHTSLLTARGSWNCNLVMGPWAKQH